MLRSGFAVTGPYPLSYEDVDPDQAVLVKIAGSDRWVGFFGLGVVGDPFASA